MTIAMHTSECCSSNERSRGPALQIRSDTLQPSPRARARRCGRPTAESGPRRVAMGSNSTAIFAKNLSWQNDTTAPECHKPGSCKAVAASVRLRLRSSEGRIRKKAGKAAQGIVSAKLIGRWEQIGQKLTALAEEVPESNFDYKPVEGVRTF